MRATLGVHAPRGTAKGEAAGASFSLLGHILEIASLPVLKEGSFVRPASLQRWELCSPGRLCDQLKAGIQCSGKAIGSHGDPSAPPL